MSKVHTLTELLYAEPEKGADYRLYLFDEEGYHSGSQWFTSGPIRWPEEQITAVEAQMRAVKHIEKGLEVRITNGGDMLVYHHKGGALLYGREDFWSVI